MMSGLKNRRDVTVALFVAFNVVLVIFVATVLVAPLLSHFAERSEDIAENADQLAHLEQVIEQAKIAAKDAGGQDNVFLPGQEERVISADLQAIVKSIATATGVNLLGVRGLPSGRVHQLRTVAVSAEVEGSMTAIRDMMRSAEGQMPMLFVTAASLRNLAAGEDGPLRADLTIMGAIREVEKPDSQGAAAQ